jgi:hypothetical protein
MNKYDTELAIKLDWPLAGTKIHNARLSWRQWVASLPERYSAEEHQQRMEVTEARAEESGRVSYLDRAGKDTMRWPLPSTYLPYFRMSWMKWVDEVKGARDAAGHDEKGMPSPAATHAA